MKYLLALACAGFLFGCGQSESEPALAVPLTEYIPAQATITSISATRGFCEIDFYRDTQHGNWERVYVGDEPEIYAQCITLNVGDPLPLLTHGNLTQIEWDKVQP